MYGLEDCPVDFEKLVASTKSNEGFRAQPYVDTTGHLSIGYGLNLDGGITQDEADYLLRERLRLAIGKAETQDWWDCVSDNDARSRAMCEILFNMGLNKLRGFTKALAALRRRDYDAAATEFLDSLWHQQTGRRAETLTTMIKTGQDVTTV